MRFLTDVRDEIKAVVKGVDIPGMDNTDRVRLTVQQTFDELFSLMNRSARIDRPVMREQRNA